MVPLSLASRMAPASKDVMCDIINSTYPIIRGAYLNIFRPVDALLSSDSREWLQTVNFGLLNA